MAIRSSRLIFSAALVSVAALTVPLAATAEPQNRNQPQHQQGPQSQHQQGPQPYTAQRPDQGHNAQGRPDQGRQQANQSGRYRITSTVNIRSGAGTNFRRLGQFRAGQTVQVDQVRNGWLHVNGQGWISAQYARRA